VNEIVTIHCPNCGASDVRESHTRRMADAVLGMFGLVAYRCRACRNRFHKRPPAGESEVEIENQGAEPPGEKPESDSR
jgi:hypothetical protein